MWHVAMNAANTQCLSASVMVRCQKGNTMKTVQRNEGMEGECGERNDRQKV